jgi:hypothetical protein
LLAIRPFARSLALAVMTVLVGSSTGIAAEATLAAQEWTPFEGGSETMCADGSAVGFLERAADPTRVVLFLEGGGACFSEESCDFDGDDKAYISSSEVTPQGLRDRGGIFDFDEPENPLADYSFVYVPYCTGDGHLGTASHRYADELTVEHKGFINATTALDHLVATYPDASELVVTGSSAGSIPTPLMAGLAADVLPDARIVTLGDSSGAYPDDPVLNAFIGSLWGAEGAIPDWPETQDIRLDEWSIPGLYAVAGQHAPGVTLAKFDYAYDDTQAFYGSLVGVGADELVTLIDDNEAAIEAQGVDVASYVAPGEAHTIIGSHELFELEVEGIRFIDWFTALVKGDTPADVHCEACD